MNLRDILTIYDYNYWATGRILKATVHMSPEQLIVSTVHSFGSLRGTLVHTLDSEHSWRMLLQQHVVNHGTHHRSEAAGFQNYLVETTNHLDALSSDQFEPDLSILDEVIGSLAVNTP